MHRPKNPTAEQCPELFTGIGKLRDFQLTVPLKLSVCPVAQPVRRIPYGLREHTERLIKELLENGITEKGEGPTPWLSPAHLVPKKGQKNGLHLVTDMRQANEANERERFPIPTTEEILDKLNGSACYSKLDLKWGYHQIELALESREITTFSTHFGIFGYTRLMFDMNCAPEMYHRISSQLF
jgi:hypothetical protein